MRLDSVGFPIAQGVATSDFRSSGDAIASSVYVDKPDLRPHATPDGTVTVLFSDIEGSTDVTERLGDQRWLEVRHEHNAVICRQAAKCGAFQAKAEGDGFMLALQSAPTAMGCAVDMQRAMARRNDAAEEPTKVRIGLHKGEAVKEDENFFGRHGIVAACMAGQVPGGEIRGSSPLKELTESAGHVDLSKGREVDLKGFAGAHRVYEVVR